MTTYSEVLFAVILWTVLNTTLSCWNTAPSFDDWPLCSVGSGLVTRMVSKLIFSDIQQKVLFITSLFSDEPQTITVTLSSISNLIVLRILPGDSEQPQTDLALNAQAKSS
jgi:hypothetical protein